MPGSLPYLGWILPPRSACPPARKRWKSEEAVDPSPQSPAKGCRNCAFTSAAKAAEKVSSRTCHACSQARLAQGVPEQDSAILLKPRWMASARRGVSSRDLCLAKSPVFRGVKGRVKSVHLSTSTRHSVILIGGSRL